MVTVLQISVVTQRSQDLEQIHLETIMSIVQTRPGRTLIRSEITDRADPMFPARREEVVPVEPYEVRVVVRVPPEAEVAADAEVAVADKIISSFFITSL